MPLEDLPLTKSDTQHYARLFLISQNIAHVTATDDIFRSVHLCTCHMPGLPGHVYSGRASRFTRLRRSYLALAGSGRLIQNFRRALPNLNPRAHDYITEAFISFASQSLRPIPAPSLRLTFALHTREGKGNHQIISPLLGKCKGKFLVVQAQGTGSWTII